MRIISGSLKGRRLKTPTWEGLRPTSDKLRETLFNILAPRVEGSRVLDGYAGTGAVGIEALSRGAAHVTFVERDRRAQALVAENLSHCAIRSGYAIIRDSIQRALATLGPAEPFDIILLDPPYGFMHDNGSLAVLGAAGALMSAEGVLVVEHARRDPALDVPGALTRTRTVEAGDSALTFYTCPR